jgi:hypothetical protein
MLLRHLKFIFLVQLQAKRASVEIAADMNFLTMLLESIAFCSPVKWAKAGQVSWSWVENCWFSGKKHSWLPNQHDCNRTATSEKKFASGLASLDVERKI